MRLGSPVFAGHCLGQFWRLYRYVRMKFPFGINNTTVTVAQEHFQAVLGAALSFARRRSNYPHLMTQSFIQSFPGHWGETNSRKAPDPTETRFWFWSSNKLNGNKSTKKEPCGEQQQLEMGEKAASHWEGGGPLRGGGQPAETPMPQRGQLCTAPEGLWSEWELAWHAGGTRTSTTIPQAAPWQGQRVARERQWGQMLTGSSVASEEIWLFSSVRIRSLGRFKAEKWGTWPENVVKHHPGVNVGGR